MNSLQLATYDNETMYWQGSYYGLHMSFASLTAEQWTLLIDSLWTDVALEGPLEERFIPKGPVSPTSEIRYPERSTSLKTYGRLAIGNGQWVGIAILVTRSLFECVSVMTPHNMFTTPHSSEQPQHPIEDLYKQLAVRIYQHVPFMLASLGTNRECQIINELQLDEEARAQFFNMGNALISDEALQLCQQSPQNYAEIVPHLRWIPRGA